MRANCPRCDAPIVWSLQPTAGGGPLPVAVWSCSCPLSEDEWLAFGNAAILAVEARDGEDTQRRPAPQ
jgi:hypothetical protein